MDKQKQIEEMATETARIVLSCPLNQGRNCDCCKFNDKDTISYDCQSYLVAEELYNAGYRKIPEGSVVLTKEELKEKIDCCDVSMIHHDDDGKRYIEYEKYEDFTDRLGKRIQQLKGLLKQERKETVEKFAERVKEETDHGISALYDSTVDEICKEITEGV